MKQLKLYLAALLLSVVCTATYAQVTNINLSTGIYDGSGSLIPYATIDDTWQVAIPTTSPGPPTYQSVYCGIGTADNGNTYTGLDPSVRWVSPYVNALGEHSTGAPAGDYYYRTEFEFGDVCGVTSAVFRFQHIGGDDQINQVIVNGHIYTVSYGYNALFANNVMLPINPAHIVSGPNEIRLRVYNYGSPQYPTTQTGIEINGFLSIVSAGPVTGFCASAPTASSLQVSANNPMGGNHTWEIYSSPTGNQGTYSFMGNTDMPSFFLSGGGPCYLIKHKVDGECGSFCEAQSVCYKTCDDSENGECTALTPPTNLTYNSATGLLSWTPVSGAVSYVVEMTINDPKCCLVPAGTEGTFTSFVAPGNIHVVNFADLGVTGTPSCFSWRVIARCADGITAESELKCAFPGSGGTKGPKTSGIVAGVTENNNNGTATAAVKVFPNPAKGMVSMEITTQTDVGFNATITDEKGKMIKRFEGLKTKDSKYTLMWNSEGMAKGIYLVKIETSGSQILVNKIIIE